MNTSAIVQKLWNYCNVLRDDGMSYGDYVEQLTYLLFLKMADERTKPPYKQPSIVPKNYDWPSLLKKDGDELFEHYRNTLKNLGKEKGLLGLIFMKSQNKFQDPAKLRRLIVDLIDNENWSVMSADVKGDAYEGLLEKNAQDTKSGAGQYFTPRPLIRAMVDAINPKPGETVCDPACGTGGFFLAAHDYIVGQNPNMTKTEKRDLKEKTFKGWELVQSTARLCAMNLMLHGIGSDENRIKSPSIETLDEIKKEYKVRSLLYLNAKNEDDEPDNIPLFRKIIGQELTEKSQKDSNSLHESVLKSAHQQKSTKRTVWSKYTTKDDLIKKKRMIIQKQNLLKAKISR